MKLLSLEVENFRGYKDARKITFDDLTTLIGKNDIGKSTILEALEIFFNNDTVKIDQADANVFSKSKTVKITCEFSEHTETIVLDSESSTTLRTEFLLTDHNTLKIQKLYDCSKKTPSCEVFIIANHPSVTGAENLLELKEKDLRDKVKSLGLDVSLKGNPTMRKAIWKHFSDLQLKEIPIPVSKPKEDSKRIWEKIEILLPMFAIFQSDRASKDSDGEVQNPLKGAVATAIAEAQTQIAEIEQMVREKSEEIAKLTHDALKQIDPNLAESLEPKFSPPAPSKWANLFSLGMETNGNIALNKRGSGVRRMILVSFFKAEAERKLQSNSKSNVIYAIEEPETSQHPSNQKILINSFKDLSATENCQVILTTHSPGLASDLPTESIRFVSSSSIGATPNIDVGVDVFDKVADALGLVPDSRVKVLVFVEGPTDVQALKCLSNAIHMDDQQSPNLETDERFAFVVSGGATLKHWVTKNYLGNLGLTEFHLYDNDVATYQGTVDQVNERDDNRGSHATLTAKHEIESYLHSGAVLEAFGFEIEVADHPDNKTDTVPREFAKSFAEHHNRPNVPSDGTAKKKLAESAFPKMTAAWIDERDPAGEVRGWFRRLRAMADQA